MENIQLEREIAILVSENSEVSTCKNSCCKVALLELSLIAFFIHFRIS